MSVTTDHKNTVQPLTERLQFRFVFAITFLWFFICAVGCRLTLQPLANSLPGETCFQSAKRSAYSLVPYAFMRI
ncbi:MAG: hypothetical protein RLZZ602_2314 [Pseudomonadota bacterium]|jgi:hypothetical protein